MGRKEGCIKKGIIIIIINCQQCRRHQRETRHTISRTAKTHGITQSCCHFRHTHNRSDIRRDVYRLFRFGWRPISDREVRQQIRERGLYPTRQLQPASRPHGPASKMHSYDGYRKILDQEKHDDVSFTTVFHHRGHRGHRGLKKRKKTPCPLCPLW